MAVGRAQTETSVRDGTGLLAAGAAGAAPAHSTYTYLGTHMQH